MEPVTWRGNSLCVARRIRRVKLNPSIVEAVKLTAKQLGNRPAACRKYYIHPAVFASYAEQTIFSAIPKPALHATAARNKLGMLERAVLRLVRSYTSPSHAKASWRAAPRLPREPGTASSGVLWR